MSLPWSRCRSRVRSAVSAFRFAFTPAKMSFLDLDGRGRAACVVEFVEAAESASAEADDVVDFELLMSEASSEEKARDEGSALAFFWRLGARWP